MYNNDFKVLLEGWNKYQRDLQQEEDLKRLNEAISKVEDILYLHYYHNRLDEASLGSFFKKHGKTVATLALAIAAGTITPKNAFAQGGPGEGMDNKNRATVMSLAKNSAVIDAADGLSRDQQETLFRTIHVDENGNPIDLSKDKVGDGSSVTVGMSQTSTGRGGRPKIVSGTGLALSKGEFDEKLQDLKNITQTGLDESGKKIKDSIKAVSYSLSLSVQRHTDRFDAKIDQIKKVMPKIGDPEQIGSPTNQLKNIKEFTKAIEDNLTEDHRLMVNSAAAIYTCNRLPEDCKTFLGGNQIQTTKRDSASRVSSDSDKQMTSFNDYSVQFSSKAEKIFYEAKGTCLKLLYAYGNSNQKEGQKEANEIKGNSSKGGATLQNIMLSLLVKGKGKLDKNKIKTYFNELHDAYNKYFADADVSVDVQGANETGVKAGENVDTGMLDMGQ